MTATTTEQSSEQREARPHAGAMRPVWTNVAVVVVIGVRGHRRARHRRPPRPRQQRAAAARPTGARGRRGAGRRDPVAPGVAELHRDAGDASPTATRATFETVAGSDRGGQAAVRLGRRSGRSLTGRDPPAAAARRQGLRARDAARPRRRGLRACAQADGRREHARRSPSPTCSAVARAGSDTRTSARAPAPVRGLRRAHAGARTARRRWRRTRRSPTSTTRCSSARNPRRRKLIASSTGGAAARRPHPVHGGAVRRHAPAPRDLAAERARRLAAGLAAVDPRRVRAALHRGGRAHGVAALEAAQRGRGARGRERASLRRPAHRRPDPAAQPAAQTLPEAPGLEFGAIYAPGTEGIDIGGDWYEVVARADGTVVVVVGDVSGHGLEAATMMASLRFAIRAYAADGDGPATILGKLTHLVNVGRDGHFATVLCGVVDPVARTATLGRRRPPPPAARRRRHDPLTCRCPVGPPVGVVAGRRVRRVAGGPARRRHAAALHRRARRAAGRDHRRRLRAARRRGAAGSTTSRSPTRSSRSSAGRFPTAATTTPRCSASAGGAGPRRPSPTAFPAHPRPP